MEQLAEIEEALDHIWGQYSVAPKTVYIELRAIRRNSAEGKPLRDDILVFLDLNRHVPDEAIVVLTADSIGILVDGDYCILAFRDGPS